jgi:hypothetical protein
VAALWSATAGFGAACTAIALGLERWLWPGRVFAPAAAVGAITTAVVGGDLVSGAHLQIFTMGGYSPLVAGRFAGIGNVGFGFFAAAALLAAGGLVEALACRPGGRAGEGAARAYPVALGAFGLVVVGVDGAPIWGSDVGGVLALVPAFAVLGWTVAGVRVSWRRAGLAAAAAVTAGALLAVLDYARPARSRTHLGRFVGELAHGRAWTTLHRKAASDLALLGHSWLTLLVPLLVVLAAWAILRPARRVAVTAAGAPMLRPTLIAVLVMAVVAAVVNDSGVAIPPVAALIVLPAAMAVIARGAGTMPQFVSTQQPAGLLR